MKLIRAGALFLLTCPLLAAEGGPAPPGKMVDVDGRKWHLNCSGRGSPTVVLEAGLGDSSLAWSLVQPELASITRVCSYDRAGTAWSHDAGPQHGLSKAADDLNNLLKASGEGPPYLLVGHSWGGWLVTVFARRHLRKVAGIVLVDSSVGFDPPTIERMPASPGEGPPRGLLIVKQSANEQDPFRRLPPDLYNVYLWTESLPHLDDVDDPDEPLATVEAAVHGVLPFDDMPLVLIAARNAEGDLGRDTDKGKTIRSRILDLSRDSKVVYAESGHHVALEKPDTVTGVVHEMINRLRRP